MTREELIALIETVIDENGEMRSCGREQCRKLIMACSDYFNGILVGNPETYYVDIEAVKAAYTLLKRTKKK